MPSLCSRRLERRAVGRDGSSLFRAVSEHVRYETTTVQTSVFEAYLFNYPTTASTSPPTPREYLLFFLTPNEHSYARFLVFRIDVPAFEVFGCAVMQTATAIIVLSTYFAGCLSLNVADTVTDRLPLLPPFTPS